MTKSNCSKCTKYIATHKPRLHCSICLKYFHPKCCNLKPSDIEQLIDSWFCPSCNDNIFPFATLSYPQSSCIDDRSVKVNTNNDLFKNCETCLKPGRKLKTCDFCGHLSHPNCFYGPDAYGCIKCMREILPDLDSNINELYPIGQNYFEHKLFNPYDPNSDINNIGNYDIDNQQSFEQLSWDSCSNLLNNCKYHEFSDIKTSRSTELKVLSLNIRSINDKIKLIKDDIVNFSKFDILCFNETCCSNESLPFGGDELLLEPFHPPSVQSPARASNRGGGLIIYVNKNLCFENDVKNMVPLSDNTDYQTGEFLFIEITRPNEKNIIIGNMYRSPQSAPNNFINSLEQKLGTLKRHSNKLIVLASDSNIDLLKFDKHEPTDRLVNTMSEHGFAPVISRPTRITSHSATLIDHIFVNQVTAVTRSGIITTDLSDHLAPFTNILIVRKSAQILEENYISRQMSNENLLIFKNEIEKTDWSFIVDLNCADKKYSAFEMKYREIYEKSFPAKSKKKTRRKIDKPWILPWLEGACDRKNTFYKVFIKNPNVENETRYRKMKKFVTKHIKLAKQKYYNNYFKKYSDDSRKQWCMINQLLNRAPKSKKNITKLCDDEETITNPHEIANKFNNFFCNVAQRLKDDSGHNSDRGRPPDTSATLNSSNRSHINMPHTDCTIVEIKMIIDSLKNKATSDLAIQPLKFVSNEISPVIQHLVSASLEQGIFPDLLKRAKVIPLHKSGSRSQITNYRPISLLSCFSKIFEKVMHKRLTSFLEQNKILFQSQYGFRALHSCEHALLEAQNCLNLALDKKQIAVLLLIDFSKAFDMVDHNILLHKLEHYGIRGNLLAWFKSYLIGRQQHVHVNGNDSEKLTLKYSVPQGSILGPILFILYTNDLPNINKFARFIFFADDANIIVTGNNITEIKDKINELLISINSWVTTNGLKLNLTKTKYMVFTNQRNNDLNDLDIRLNGVDIKKVESERFLGVILETNMTWKKHISSLASKIARNSGMIYNLNGIVPEKVLKTLYNSFIQSHLNYCSNVWGLGSKASINKIFTAQKKAVRAVECNYTNYFYNSETGELPCHTKGIFNRYKFLTIHNLIAKNCLVAMHKVFMGTSPTSINSLFSLYKNGDRGSRRSVQIFDIPSSRLVALDSSLPFKGPRLYNHVIQALKINQTSKNPEHAFLIPFKRFISSYLLTTQEKGDADWELENFALYNIMTYKD